MANPNPRNRAARDPSMPAKTTPAIIESMTLSGANAVEITFATRVQPGGATPRYTASSAEAGPSAATASGVAAVSATSVTVTFTSPIAGMTLHVPEADPGIRTPAGGFVPAGNYALPAA